METQNMQAERDTDYTDMDSSDKQKKLYFMTENLTEFHSKLHYDIQSKIPLEDLSLLGKL